MERHTKHKQFTHHWFSAKKLNVYKNQIALLYRNELLESVFKAGEYEFRDAKNELSVAFVTLNNQPIDKELAQYIEAYLPEVLEAHCFSIQVKEDEVALLYENDVLVELIPPTTKRLYWKSAIKQVIETASIHETQPVAGKIMRQFVRQNARTKTIAGTSYIFIATVPDYHRGILKIDGIIESLLSPGQSAYWHVNRQLTLELVDTRMMSMEINGQEILTRDKVTLRINLVANWQYTDILKAHSTFSDVKQHLYRELQFALREVVGTRTLDELLENKEIINQVVKDRLTLILKESGLQVHTLGVKDILLPGEMKTILSQVVEAEKAAQANVIKRREETSATRSLLNTAKVMENNPVALRLKELETLERVVEHIEHFSVYGGLDNVLNGLVNMTPNAKTK